MKLSRVVGTVTATVHHPAFDGQTLLLCQPVAPDGSPIGDFFIAVDHAQAGTGDLVLVNQEGGGARQVLGYNPKDAVPIRSVIVGVVDTAEETA